MYESLFRNALFPLYESVLRGRSTLRHLEELDRQQWLSQEEIRAIQWRKLKRLLRHAYEQVPFYRQRWEAIGVHPEEIRAPDDFSKLPMLSKRDLRDHSNALEALNYRGRNTIRSRSGGSTGTPVSFAYSRESEEWRVAGAARSDRWAGWDFGRREAYLWGMPLESGPWWLRGKKKAHHALLRRRVFSAFQLTDDTLPRVVRELSSFRPDVIVGYASALHVVSDFILKQRLRVPSPRGIISSAEMLYDFQRATIEAAFGCRVFNRYGCREMRLIAAECERHDGLHLNADNLFEEFLRPDGTPCASGEVGTIVLTDLNNYGMPMIRYQIGDLGAPSDRPCACGRGLPVMETVTGRTLDVIHLPDGRHLDGHFFTHLILMRDFPGLESYQFQQTAPDEMVLRIVPGPGWSVETCDRMRAVVERHLGNAIRLRFEFVDEIPLTSAGKWRVVIGSSSSDPPQMSVMGNSQ